MIVPFCYSVKFFYENASFKYSSYYVLLIKTSSLEYYFKALQLLPENINHDIVTEDVSFEKQKGYPDSVGKGDKKMELLERNAPCWCGSGKKYKKCHEAFDEKLKMYENKGVLMCALP